MLAWQLARTGVGVWKAVMRVFCILRPAAMRHGAAEIRLLIMVEAMVADVRRAWDDQANFIVHGILRTERTREARP